MGCCASQNADSKAARLARWRSTGIVALRDSKLKASKLNNSPLHFLPSLSFLDETETVNHHCRFLTVPDEVLDLERSVRTLDLTHNRLVDIPTEISKLINMQRLVLAHNVIERLPSNLGKLQYLKVMTLDGNKITSLPDELGQLVRLEKLSISGNMLADLPETIGSLRNLSLLNVSNNKLKSLPPSIGSCFSLEEVQADDNQIENLPDSVCNLIHLKSLSLDRNNVSQIPSNLLKDCKALQNISLHENPISMDQFQQMEGFLEFEGRRKRKFDKQIDANVMISSKGLDEGVDL
ncbi:Plant intracellular Ras-group- LRR protein 7 [Turnera subulata]|uniref:Plant intracellular Ras-group- LRR protein 7 n=1 Tax=Turnera subulata TaxID=218843 RepID=A0A9Q0G3E7_9ROSI|nr:Plant intracellular Ras-group- LRR protein 7 [Turnera subulata]